MSNGKHRIFSWSLAFAIFIALWAIACDQSLPEPSHTPSAPLRDPVEPLGLTRAMGSGSGLALTIEENRPSSTAGNLTLTAVISNTSKTAVVIYPYWRPAGHRDSSMPVAEISFYITNMSGHEVAPIERNLDYRQRKINPHSFLSLGPGDAYARRIVLTGIAYGYTPLDSGRYQISARIIHAGPSWVKNVLAGGKMIATELHYNVDSVFEGTLESNVLEIEVP